MEARTDTTLTTAEVLDVLDHKITRRQLELAGGNADGGGRQGVPYQWSPDIVRRLQVAVALESEPPRAHPRSSSLPGVIAAVLEADEPQAQSWAVYRQGVVSYVLWPADVSQAIPDAAVVARIGKLWPDLAKDEEGS